MKAFLLLQKPGLWMGMMENLSSVNGAPPKEKKLSDINILIDEIEYGPKPEMNSCKSILIFNSGVDWTPYPSTSAHVGKANSCLGSS